MKSYSGEGIQNEKLARLRRRDYDRTGRFCRGSYVWIDPVGKEHAQLENNWESMQLLLLGAYQPVKSAVWFRGSLERWLDGFPVEVLR